MGGVDMRYSRQKKILELITDSEIETQDQLVNMLRNDGFEVTQATVSRDIKELQLIKTLTSNGKYKYTVNTEKDTPVSDRFIKIFRETVTSFVPAQNLIVIKTLSGCAAATGEAIDCISVPHIVGSVAGDNTLLLVVDHQDNVEEVINRFNQMLLLRNKDQ